MLFLAKARQASLPSRFLTVARRYTSKKSASSTRWLSRQQNDPYVRRRTSDGSTFVSRSAFKLVELDKIHRFLRQGARIVDLGAAPGGWTQVASAAQSAQVIAVDLLDLTPSVTTLPAVRSFKGDFLDPSVQAKVRDALEGEQADVVLSDMVCIVISP
jgi:23S rRNA (uridine2552-2'-O)-methyltransferase